MKHLIFIKTILLLFVALITASCSARDKEISFEALPQQAQQFIKQYFPKTECARIVQEKDNGIIEYDVYLNDGTEIEFCTKGVWTSVDCKFTTMPAGILPEAIMTDIANRYPNAVVHKAEKQLGGYEIDINGWELYYDKQGVFVRAVMDW